MNIRTEADRTTYLPLRKVAAVGIGNALEFYDFLTYSFFAIQIGHTFFPTEYFHNSLLSALATFGIGFVMRPLGGIIIGRYGDRVGRKPAMEMLVTGEMISAEHAERIGLINHVVAPGTEREEALKLARKITEKSASAIRMGKEAFYRQLEMPLADGRGSDRGSRYF